jgi:hypothetical protein
MTDEAQSPAIPAPSGKPAFWDRLKDDFYQKPIEGIVASATVLGFLIGMAGLVLVSWQLRDVRAQLDDEAYGHLYDWLRTLDERLIDHPEFRPYFSYGKTFPADKPLDSVIAFAEFKLDFIDYFFTQAAHLDRDNIEYDTWARYFNDSFKSSPVLCSVLKDEQDQYGYEIRYFASPLCRGVIIPAKKGGSDVFWRYFSRPQ